MSILHTLKSLLRGQFRGSRWVAWNRSAQWITEWAMQFRRGESILTFVAPDEVGRTFMFFVIVLFVHILRSVFMLLWILIHVIGVSRVKIWAPRWVTIGTSLILAMVAVWRPATRPHGKAPMVG